VKRGAMVAGLCNSSHPADDVMGIMLGYISPSS